MTITLADTIIVLSPQLVRLADALENREVAHD